LNHFSNGFGDFIWHQVRYPNNSTLVVAVCENLDRRVVYFWLILGLQGG
jgi:hypothetical protein